MNIGRHQFFNDWFTYFVTRGSKTGESPIHFALWLFDFDAKLLSSSKAFFGAYNIQLPIIKGKHLKQNLKYYSVMKQTIIFRKQSDVYLLVYSKYSWLEPF